MSRKAKSINVLVVKPGQPVETAEIEPSLETFQTLVGGYIEALDLDDGVSLYMNDDGFGRLLPNRRIPDTGIVVVGPFVVFRTTGPDDASLTPAQVDHWRAYFDSAAAQP